MVYDARSDRVVLFGGTTPAGYTDETWTYDFSNNSWTLRGATGPAARGGHALAYDSRAGVVVLFGGSTASGLSRTTWTYDVGTNTWTNQNPALRPGARSGHALAYDPRVDRMILFGGRNVTDLKGETYAYDLATNAWASRSPSNAPSSRMGHAMAYDAQADRVVLFGGLTAGGPDGGTWTYSFDSNVWTDMAPATAPRARWNHSMAYDARAGRVLLFGGLMDTGPTNETWTYDFETNAWTRLESIVGPRPRASAAMAYDERSDVALVFGGNGSAVLGDTWAYRFHAAQPPSAPRTLRASAGDAQVQLSWQLPVEDGYSRIMHYRVYRNGSLLVELGELLAHRDTGLANGVGYVYRVAAVNAVGEGPPSAEVTAFPASLRVTVSASPVIGDAPLTVHFTSAVFGGIGNRAYNWTFGEGNASALANPSHTYQTQGSYTATLVVTDGRGVEAGNATVVTVFQLLSARPTASPASGFLPLTVSFRAYVSGGVAPYVFLWGFGDGTTSAEPEPTHTYRVAGSYQVVVTIWDSRGRAVSETIRVGANEPPPRSAGSGIPLWPAFLVGVVVLAAIGVFWRRGWFRRILRRR